MRQKVTTKTSNNFGEIKSTTPIKSHSRQASYSKSKGIDQVVKSKGIKQTREVQSQDRQNNSDNERRLINIDINKQKKGQVAPEKLKDQDKKEVVAFQKNLSEPDFLISESFKRKQNFIEEGSQANRIQLIVRVRPFLMTEQLKECLKVINENGIRLFKEYHQIHFKFDNILLPKDNQDCVFKQISSMILSILTQSLFLDTVNGFMKGVNGTIFAYGQTGAGKTYSIMGGGFQDNNQDKEIQQIMTASQSLFQNEKKGILPRTLDSVFHQLDQMQTSKSPFNIVNKIRLQISFFEIYNEKIFDLLSPTSHHSNPSVSSSIGNKKQFSMMKKDSVSTSGSRDHLDLREEKDGYFSIVDLRRIECQTLAEAYSWVEKGLIKRSTSSTSLNSNSSRSHSIFQIYLERVNEEGVLIKSKLRIVDLAGSEKYTLKKDLPAVEKSIKVQELTAINSSLSALGQCISALADQARKHIPYRNSKLTRVLKDSLDENSNVAMIICISPSVDSYKETFSTLQFADRAKKAILDGRNFSDSKLLGGGEQFLQQYKLMMNNGVSEGGRVGGMQLNDIIKAYQEEKGVRKELDKYMNQNYLQKEVFDELDRLKKQNKELQEKVSILEQKKPIKQPLKGCLRLKDTQAVDTIVPPKAQNTMNIQDEDVNESDSPLTKRVHFATKLENDDSLDSETRERIEHNLKYNDDTIFDNISIFRDLNNSGIVLLPKKLKDNKDVHPSVLKRRSLLKEGRVDIKDLSDQEEDEEKEEQKEVKEDDEIKEPSDIKEEGVLESTSPRSEGKKLDQFWAVQQLNHDKYYKDEKMGVSPIQRRYRNANNNSSQDVSKDLIDLESEHQLGKVYSGSRVGDKTMGTSKGKKNQQSNMDQRLKEQMQRKRNEDELQQSIGLDEEEDKERDLTMEEDDDENMPKDYHVCDSSEQFFGNQQDQILSDSIVMDMMIVEEAGNGSQDNQNTLMLDSQSMIIEAGEGGNNPIPLSQRDPNLSQHMQSFEASIINQQQNYPHHMKHLESQNPYSGSGQYFTQNILAHGFQSSSNGTSSIVNTDILTYSLTNTYTTIESLHDELAVIKNGLEQSQKRGANILKTIQKYAKEIEENKISDEEYEENVQSNEDSFKEDFSQLEDENLNFIKDIKGYHDKIHSEIGQLKNILMDQSKAGSSPLSTRKHILSERVPQKSQPSLFQTPGQASQDAIENTQNLINEIKKEMSDILGLNSDVMKSQSSSSNYGGGSQVQYESNVSKAQKSIKIIDLLENLQQSLLHSVKPILSLKRTQNTELKVKNAPLTSAQNNQSLSSSQNFMFSPSKYIKHNQLKVKKTQGDLLRKSSDQRLDYNQQTLKFQQQQQVHKSSIKSNTKMSQYLLSGGTKPSQTNSKQIPFGIEKQDLQNIPNFTKSPPRQQVNLPQFNQIPPILQVSPPQANSMMEDEDNQLFDPIQKTPEIFKSLSQFNEQNERSNQRDYNYSSRRSDHHNSMSMQLKNTVPLNQQQSLNLQSQEQQSYINGEYGAETNLPFYSKLSQQQNDTYNGILNRINNSDFSNGNTTSNQQDFQITLRQNNNNPYSEKQDPFNNGGSGAAMNSINNISQIGESNVNNTTTNNNNNGTYRKKGGDNTLTLIFDSDEEEQENDTEQNQSVGKVKEIEEFFFNEENSKIERGSSVNRASFQVSNSFQAENQLLFMENNNIDNSNNYNNFQRDQLMNNLKLNKNRKSSHSANSRENSLLFNNKTPILNKFGALKLRGQESSRDHHLSNQIQFSIQEPKGVQIPSTQQNKFPHGGPLLQQISSIQQTDEASTTSKQSVSKYWNQFFKKESQQQQVPPSESQSRNNNAMSRSAYQSRTSKNTSNKLFVKEEDSLNIPQSQGEIVHQNAKYLL